MTKTIENKAKFFALYWGQPVMWCMGGDDYERLKYIVRSGNMRLVEKSWLELTPLSQISDEDYRNLVQSEVMNPEHPSDEIDISNGRLGGIHLSDVSTVDYLRSRGYALPWMGISVATLVEWGWVKLKGGAND